MGTTLEEVGDISSEVWHTGLGAGLVLTVHAVIACPAAHLGASLGPLSERVSGPRVSWWSGVKEHHRHTT